MACLLTGQDGGAACATPCGWRSAGNSGDMRSTQHKRPIAFCASSSCRAVPVSVSGKAEQVALLPQEGGPSRSWLRLYFSTENVVPGASVVSQRAIRLFPLMFPRTMYLITDDRGTHRSLAAKLRTKSHPRKSTGYLGCFDSVRVEPRPCAPLLRARVVVRSEPSPFRNATDQLFASVVRKTTATF